MKPSIYIETTVPSYYTSRPSSNVIIAGHQVTTREWWNGRLGHFRAFISQLVLDEASRGDPEEARQRLVMLKDFPLLELQENVITLACYLIEEGPLPQKAARDALHIAVAAVHDIDFLLTWNCTHMANAEMSSAINRICRENGFECPVICTPEGLMGV